MLSENQLKLRVLIGAPINSFSGRGCRGNLTILCPLGSERLTCLACSYCVTYLPCVVSGNEQKTCNFRFYRWTVDLDKPGDRLFFLVKTFLLFN